MNVARDTLRRRGKELLVDNLIDESVFGDGSKTPEEIVSAEEDIRSLRDAIGSMPDGLRAVTVLFYMQEEDITAIAKTLGIPEGTVKSRLSRARDWLRREMRK